MNGPNQVATVEVYRAQATLPDVDVPDLRIETRQPFPRDFVTIREADAAHLDCAQRIADALVESLPGGTLDRLCGLLALRLASSLVVQAPRPKRRGKR